MSAWVKFDTGRARDALVIPVEAMSVVGHQQFCYVVGDDGVERRAITTRGSTRDLLEVTEGLDEGERVVLRSLDVRGIPVDDTTRGSREQPLARADRVAEPIRIAGAVEAEGIVNSPQTRRPSGGRSRSC